MLVLEALGAPPLSRDPASGQSLPPKLCAPPATGQSSHEYVQSPDPPPRQHLAPAAGWRGWCCPQCWRLGRCRPRRCFAPPSGSAAFRSAPRVGVSEGGPWHLLAQWAADPPALPRPASRGRQQARLGEARAKPLLWRVSQPGLTPSVLQPVPRPSPAPHCPAAGLTCT